LFFCFFSQFQVSFKQHFADGEAKVGARERPNDFEDGFAIVVALSAFFA
jgi:hypothetical protein